MSSAKYTQENDLEGTESQELGLDNYPLDSFLIRSQQITIKQVFNEVEDDIFILHPDFQRDFIWTKEQQNRLIESVLMRIPLPVFYFAETEDGKTLIVDGLQRICTFRSFMKDEFSVELVIGDNKKESKKFSELSPKLKNRIERTNLILYIIDEKAPSRAKLDIFERVNSGTPLTRQQMRNCLFMGDATKWLADMASTSLFQEATNNSLNPKTMRDRELINRFCAFSILGVDTYKGHMDDYLAAALKLMNSMDKKELDALTGRFKQSMQNNKDIFKKHAFRRSIGKESLSVINASLFDICSVAFSKISSETAARNKNKLYSIMYKKMKDSSFIESITHSTHSPKHVHSRFDYIDDMYGEFYD